MFYTRAGKDAVPSADTDGDGVPDFVNQVGALYEEVLTFYLGRGYLQPPSDANISDNGGDGRFDVYLIDFGSGSDGHYTQQSCTGNVCIGYMIQENDFVGFGYPSATVGNRILASHEFFHAVQAAYDANEGSIFAEGTAVWSTAQFDPSTIPVDFEGFIGGYLDDTSHSLDRSSTGAVDPFAYGSAIFFQFLGEKYDIGLILSLWQAAANDATPPGWMPDLATLLEARSTTFADAFTTFSTWNLFTQRRADPTRAYVDGSGFPLVGATASSLPYEDDELRVFYASSQTLSFDPAGRASIEVAILPVAGATTDTLSPLRLVVAPVMGNTIGTVTTVNATDAVAPIDVTGATSVLVVYVQTAQSGDSTKGIACIGTPDEVATCTAKNTPAVVSPAPTMTTMSTTGCDYAPRAPLPLYAGFLLLLAWSRRRRAR